MTNDMKELLKLSYHGNEVIQYIELLERAINIASDELLSIHDVMYVHKGHIITSQSDMVDWLLNEAFKKKVGR